ncbi:MAG: hypothetical protein LUG54_01825, partial [Clostridiales bacterium]|nr:hypothetical protein [Clostridiales bacterium]
MLKRKRSSVVAWMLAAALSVSMVPSYTALAADDSTAAEDTQEESAGTSITIDGDTKDPVSAIETAINDATEDVTIYLTAEAAEGEDEVVYSFEEPLTVPAGISVTLEGSDDTEYIFQAADSTACSDSATEKVSTGFVNIYGSLSLTNVTIDANEQGRAVYVSDGTLVMESNAIVENGYLTSTHAYNYIGAGILMRDAAALIMKNDCYVRYNTIVISKYHAIGAGICNFGTGTVYLYEGSHVSDNVIKGTSEDTSCYANGAGIYCMASRLYMEGCYIENNSIINMYGNAAGAGLYSNAEEPETAWKDITISGNRIEHMSSSTYAYGAGIYGGGAAAADVKMQGGTVTGNSITGYATYANGAGIYTANAGASAAYRPVFEDVSITDNVIDCEITNAAYGAGLYSAVIYMGGDMQIIENTLNGEDSNFYSRSTKSRYAAYLTSALGAEASVGFRSAQATSTGTYAAIEGDADSDYTMTQSDFSKLYYEDSEYDLIYEDGTAKVAGREPTGTGGTFHVSTSAELISYLENASNRATGTDGADSTGGTTNIILDKDIVLEEQPLLNSGRYATITSDGDHTYSIMAGTALSGTEMDTMFYVGGSLELTNVTLDAQQKGRVIEALSGADLTIGEGATVTGGYAVSGSVYGVGIRNAENSTLTIAGGTVTGNTANDSSVTDDDGNAIAATSASGLGVDNKGTLVISDGGSITNNVDYAQQTNVGSYTGTTAGGIYNGTSGTVVITDGTVSGNVVGSNAGGIYTAGTVIISGQSTISDNIALGKGTSDVYTGGAGGGMYIAGGTVTLDGENVAIENNESMWGGGVYMSASSTYPTLNINGASIRNNTARITRYSSGSGGGIYMSNGAAVNMTSGTIEGNRVAPDDDVDFDNAQQTLKTSLETNGYGGGIYVAGAGSANTMVSVAEGVPVLNLSGGTITDNYAYAGGSGIFVSNYAGGSRTSSIGSGYNFYGSGVLNVSGSPVVSGNVDDDILLAASRYIDDDEDWNEEYTIQTGTQSREYTGLRENVIYPVYLHIVGELTEGADLHVSKELLEYDAGTVYVADERQTVDAYDNIIVEGSENYEITEENLNSVLDVVDIDILTDGFWQLSATTVDVSDDSDDSSSNDNSSDGSEDEDTSSVLTAIEGISLTVTTVVANGEDLTYTGSALTPAIVVTATAEDGTSAALTEDTDYDIVYEDNTNAGTASYTITAKGLYQGTVTGEFTIEGKSLTDEDVTVTLASELCLIDADSEEAQVQTPAVTVTANGTTLTQDEDYTVTYADNASYGTAAVTVTGTGNYTGTVTKTFSIRYSGACLSEETDADGNTILCYETDGVVQSDYTGLVTEDETTYYVVSGVVDSDFTGLVTMDETTYYIAEGIWDSDYAGLVTDDEDAVWYVVDGVVDAAAETAVIDDLLYAIEEGQAALYTGLYDGLYYENGALYTGELDGLYYENGVLYTGELDGLQYVDGALYTGELDGLYYKDGTLYTGTVTVDGINYTVDDGVMSVHADTLSVRRGNIFYFSYTLKSGNADKVIAYGKATDEVLIGDWDG